jgi:chromosome segregation ATPase
MTKKNVQNMGSKETLDYGFYSNVLRKPFERLDDLRKAEAVYYEEQKAKEDKAAAKRAEAQKVEDAFKALNAARKEYKENVTQLTAEYAESLETLKKAYELGKKDIHDKLAQAEETFEKAHKEFTAAHPEGYHLTLKDGDFETTLSGSKTNTIDNAVKASNNVADLFSLLFGLC